jgi:hypothetical protein
MLAMVCLVAFAMLAVLLITWAGDAGVAMVLLLLAAGCAFGAAWGWSE